MDTTLTQQQWSFGDKVVHSAKPEWGRGVVTSASTSSHEGRPCQSLTIRFDRAGIKTISTAFARFVAADSLPQVSVMSDDHLAGSSTENPQPAQSGQSLLDDESNLVARDPRPIMSRLSDAATDPFTTPEARLKATLALYRFTPTGASLLDWAAAQSGLSDPMSRFNRHELERFFEAFAVVRDTHLKKLVLEMKRTDPSAVGRALSQAPPAAQQALRRLDAWR